MSETQMTIREMCEAFDVTARTLRFYEAKELLFPIREGQKRLFTRRDRARLTLILRGKKYGFSLEDLRQLLDLYDAGDQQVSQISRTIDVARVKLAELTAQRDGLTRTIGELADQIGSLGGLLEQKTRAQVA
jgi:DNA-binding transcriptional MerR regulator